MAEERCDFTTQVDPNTEKGNRFARGIKKM